MSARAQDYARDKVLALSRCCPGPVPFARVRLTRSHDPSVPTPALVQVNLEVTGTEVRAQAAAPTFTEAVDLVQDRLRERLRRLARTSRNRHGAEPRGVPTPRGALPAEEPRVVRHKTYAPERVTPEEAAFDMELMDYDFFLFRDATTDQDSVVFRDATGQPRLVRMRPAGVSPTPFPLAGAAAPRLTVGEAVRRLETTGDRFVFFADTRTGRGHVVYRRYDGRYGLISPVR
ncbi:sigma 54 modulation/S30EA ribosomal C-terminal domain-containing protein [Streptoalloteichus hindustanus]|uniref:sigma 54 modulation/S30EA ribosomal C-terminal domain-containing protein n=1 Tax=Streptoalloteichus hindustanus TaxID=2017 RepID=UPI00190EDF77|nr:sigma 54 modulation/S30EA ribosomal C-terminal domain-containing protein [Streptoalloteichus hindustanus]